MGFRHMDVWSIVAVVLSGAAFFLAVVGPFITAKAKIKHEKEMYERRFYTEHRHEVIESYVQAAGRCLFYCGYEQYTQVFSDFVARCSEIFMYLPETLWQDAEQLNQAVMNYHDQSSKEVSPEPMRTAYFQFCKKVSELGRKRESK